MIGMRKHIILEKMSTGVPIRYEASDRGNQINAVCVDMDPQTRRATKITRIRQYVSPREKI